MSSSQATAPRAMQSTMVYLTSEQKEALAKRARLRNTKVAAEIRAAVDAYLGGATPQDLELLDAATKRAQREIGAMLTTAEEIVAGHRRFLKEMRRLRRGGARR